MEERLVGVTQAGKVREILTILQLARHLLESFKMALWISFSVLATMSSHTSFRTMRDAVGSSVRLLKPGTLMTSKTRVARPVMQVFKCSSMLLSVLK